MKNMVDLIIRPVKIDDAADINEMRRMDGVRENNLGIASERGSSTEDFLRSLGDNDHVLVAEVQDAGRGRVVGIISLKIYRPLRCRHTANIGIMIHSDYQNRGIGRALLNKILDLADNWLMLVRIELTVFADNERAIGLYKSLGFVIEGLKKYSVIKNGIYADEYMMARYCTNAGKSFQSDLE